MPYSLKGRNVLVTGGSRGLGAVICRKFAAQGCNISINFASNVKAAEELAASLEAEFSCKTCVIRGDAEIPDDNARLVNQTLQVLGGIDIIVANAGWTKLSRFGDLHALTHEEWNKCWAINVMSHVHLMQQVAPTFNLNPDGGVYLITSSVAGKSQSGSSMAYSVSKAAGLHLMKNLAFTQGPKIRVNAILPGLLLTEWGQRFGEAKITALRSKATLEHETYLDDCADMFVSIAQNTSMTGQEVVVDAGISLGKPTQ